MKPPRIAVDCNPPAASAINCNSIPPLVHLLPSEVAYFVENSLAANTKRAYLSDLEHFLAWGGLIPSTDQTVALYLAEHVGQHAVATLARRLVGISRAHSARGMPDPVKSELVRATMRGIRRRQGSHQRQAKPLLLAELVQLASCLGDSAKDVRDRALLLLGFAGAFRRSELVGLDVEDLTFVSQGVLISLRRSKSDQLGKGRTIAVPAGKAATCPVDAVKR